MASRRLRGVARHVLGASPTAASAEQATSIAPEGAPDADALYTPDLAHDGVKRQAQHKAGKPLGVVMMAKLREDVDGDDA